MPVQIGQKPEHGFDAPMGLLTDCHRRIEKFLAAMLTVTRDKKGGALDDRDRDALEKSLRYFKNAAPNHTSDEEASLFPRLRKLDDPQARSIMAQVDQLEKDHRAQEERHAEVDRIVGQWLAEGTIGPAATGRLIELLEALEANYREHIALEDNQVFPTAQRVLSEHQFRAMGREMAERRGLDPGMPPRRCKHGHHA